LRTGLIACVVASLVPLASGADAQLVDAVRTGDRETVRDLLGRPALLTEAEPDGTTALHWAVYADDLDLVRMLLAAGADATTVSRTGVTPLGLAALNGNAVVIEALLAAGADPNAALSGGQTALMTAARTGSAASVRVLAAHGADVNAREHLLGETALIWAAVENHAEAIATLLELGADPNARSSPLTFPRREFGDGKSGRLTVLPSGAWTPLMYAARQNALEAVEALARGGANLNLADPDGTTALLVAVINAHYELGVRLLELGADPNPGDSSGMAALYAAVDMNTFAETPGRPAPVPAGDLDAIDMVTALLAHGADPNARLRSPVLVRVHDAGDRNLGEGATPLMRAARKADVDIMRRLLDGGAEAGLVTADGGTALMFAAGLGGAGRFTEYEAKQSTEADRLEAVTLLLEAGADVNAVDRAGVTALHVAAADRGADVVRLLAARGARLDLKDERGRTALDVALGVGGGGRGRPAVVREDIAALLRAQMNRGPATGTP